MQLNPAIKLVPTEPPPNEAAMMYAQSLKSPAPADNSIVYAQSVPLMSAAIPVQNYTLAFSPDELERSVFPQGQAEHIQESVNSPTYVPDHDPWENTKKVLFFGVAGFLIYKFIIKRSLK